MMGKEKCTASQNFSAISISHFNLAATEAATPACYVVCHITKEYRYWNKAPYILQ
jgi:hypothetical protein